MWAKRLLIAVFAGCSLARNGSKGSTPAVLFRKRERPESARPRHGDRPERRHLPRYRRFESGFLQQQSSRANLTFGAQVRPTSHGFPGRQRAIFRLGEARSNPQVPVRGWPSRLPWRPFRDDPKLLVALATLVRFPAHICEPGAPVGPELLITLRPPGLLILPTRREQACNCLHRIADASKHQTGSRRTAQELGSGERHVGIRGAFAASSANPRTRAISSKLEPLNPR